MSKRLPKLWRKKRGSRQVGSYLVTLDGEDVNLRTSDADEAHKRLLQAVRRGRRNFVDEIDEAAAAMDAVEGTAGDPVAQAPVGGSTPPPPTPTPIVPDVVIPPLPRAAAALPAIPANDNAEEAEATSAAAADTVDASDDGAAAPPTIDTAVLDDMLENGAAVIVDLQLQLQAVLIRKRLKREPAVVPADSPMRSAAAKAWVAQLKIWIPADVALPPWALALLLPALAMPYQAANATEIREEKAA